MLFRLLYYVVLGDGELYSDSEGWVGSGQRVASRGCVVYFRWSSFNINRCCRGIIMLPNNAFGA